MGGFFIIRRSLRLMAGGAIGILTAIEVGKLLKKARPGVVRTLKKGFAFSEWLRTKYEKAKEDAEDIMVEAKHGYQKDLEAKVETAKKEEEILRRLEEKLDKILRQRSKKEEA